MSLEGLGDMFEGDFAYTCANDFFSHVYGGPSGGSSVRRPGSEDLHQHEWKFLKFLDQ